MTFEGATLKVGTVCNANTVELFITCLCLPSAATDLLLPPITSPGPAAVSMVLQGTP